MNNNDNIINRIKAFSGLAAFVSEEEGQAMLDHFMRCYERGLMMEPKRVLNMLLQEFQRQEIASDEQNTISYALRRWVAVMAGQGKGYREIATIQPTNDYERLYVDAAKLVVAENYENMGFEISFKHACHMLDKINSETANSNKTALASAKQVAAIRKIEKLRGLEYLSDDLRELAALRLENPEYNLRELGEALSSPISRSGVNHRLMRIIEIANGLSDQVQP